MPASPRPAAAIASPHHVATQVGAEVLAEGGTAMDATVAVNAALGVIYPHMCGPGGDLFLLYYDASSGEVSCLNASGGAPALASRAAYRERGLTAVPARGTLSVTTPGAVAGWEQGLRRHGSRSLQELLAPAAAAAEGGVEVTPNLARWIAATCDELHTDPLLSRRFFDGAGKPLAGGATLVQPELGRTLRRLAVAGARDFYEGDVATQIDLAMRAGDGLLRKADLEGYEPEWIEPIRVPYRGLDIVTTPPNSQGITALLMLNALDDLGSAALQPGTVAHIEALVSAKRAAFHARDLHVSDPAFSEIPVSELLHPDFLRRAPNRPAAAAVAQRPVGGDTVYVCARDHHGNACSAIQSIYYGFGSCFVAGESGVLLHNRAHGFSLSQTHANRLEPGKRPMHTLMASLAFDETGLRHVYGSMGADGQPQFNVQVLERLLAGSDPQSAVAAPRILHGRFVMEDAPDVLRVERDLGDEIIAALEGHHRTLDVLAPRAEIMGHAHAISVATDGSARAGADPRSDGTATVIS